MPSFDQRWHEDLQVQRLTHGGTNRIRQCSDGIVEDQQVLLLVLREGVGEVAQDWLEERYKFGTCFLLESSESTAAGFLHPLVGVEYGLEKLQAYQPNSQTYAKLVRTPSMVAMKCCCLSAEPEIIQLEYRPSVQQVIALTRA